MARIDGQGVGEIETRSRKVQGVNSSTEYIEEQLTEDAEYKE